MGDYEIVLEDVFGVLFEGEVVVLDVIFMIELEVLWDFVLCVLIGGELWIRRFESLLSS